MQTNHSTLARNVQLDPAVEFGVGPTDHFADPTDHAPADAVTSADRDWWSTAGNQGDPGHAVDDDLDSACGYTDLDCSSWWLAVDGDPEYQAESERREVERHMARRRSLRVDAREEAEQVYRWA